MTSTSSSTSAKPNTTASISSVEKRFSDFWGARLSYALGKGWGNTSGTPTATNDFQVLDQRNLDQNEGPTNADRRHAVTLSGRIEVPWVQGLTGGAVGTLPDRARRSPFTTATST